MQSTSGGCSPIIHSNCQRRKRMVSSLHRPGMRVRWKKCCHLVDTLGNYNLEMLQCLGAFPVHKAPEHFYNMCPEGMSCWEVSQIALRIMAPVQEGTLKRETSHTWLKWKKEKGHTERYISFKQNPTSWCIQQFQGDQKRNLFECQDRLGGDIPIHAQTATTDYQEGPPVNHRKVDSL